MDVMKKGLCAQDSGSVGLWLLRQLLDANGQGEVCGDVGTVLSGGIPGATPTHKGRDRVGDPTGGCFFLDVKSRGRELGWAVKHLPSIWEALTQSQPHKGGSSSAC